MQNQEDRTITLRDGRTLCFAEYGDPRGFVVVNAHGGLVCRWDVAAADDAARAAGVRLISPDRPGVGRSDPQPGRTVLDWADDIAQLLDQLGVEACAAMGWSMGGQYAAGLGYALPPRVSRVAIIAGAVPLTDSAAFDQLPTLDRVFTRLSQRASLLARCCFAATGWAARSAPVLYGRFAARELGPADADVLRADGLPAFSALTAEGMRNPRGVAEEYRAWMRPWGFEPEDVSIPVDVWAGTDDQLIDHRWAPLLAERFPDSELLVRAGGHFLAHLYYDEIFRRLRG